MSDIKVGNIKVSEVIKQHAFDLCEELDRDQTVAVTQAIHDSYRIGYDDASSKFKELGEIMTHKERSGDKRSLENITEDFVAAKEILRK